jgi:2-methylisocitrate lyase-like PEP mutase family enzyme
MGTKSDAFRSLHQPGRPVILPNAWDAGSARIIVDAGFPALATTSSGMAVSLGWEDGEKTPADEVFAAIARITRAVDVPVTADVEGGYGLPPDELAERLLAAGAVGCNVEDTVRRGGGGTLKAIDAQAAYIGGLKTAAPDLFVNARVDAHVRRVDNATEIAIERGRAYRAAGADCVYPIFVFDEPTIVELLAGIGGPINVLAGDRALPLARLAELGVARVTYGGGLYHHAVAALQAELATITKDAAPAS